jgi:hypothetical protein
MPVNRVRPRKRPKRVSASAASVPNTVASVAETRPTRSVTQAALIRASLRSNTAYHWVENPPQTVTSREALKE